MRYAVEDLLHKPLRNAEDAGILSRVYIVVDGLDECQETSSQPELVPECLRLLVSCALQHPKSVRILLTSRPVPDHVENARRRDCQIQSSSILLSLYDIEEKEAIDRDIEELVRKRLCDVEEGAQWHESDPSITSQLTEQSQGVFVYAQTAVDFIVRSGGITQMKHRLQLLLTPGNTYGLGNLDLLYRTVLETAFPPADLDPETREKVRVILAWIALCQRSSGISPIYVQFTSTLCCSEIISILQQLRSVVVFDPEARDVKKENFRAMHVTFRDFLVDPARCGDCFHFDAGTMHARFAAHCVKLLRIQFFTPQYASDFWEMHATHAAHAAHVAPTGQFFQLFRHIAISLLTDKNTFCFQEYTDSMFSLYEVLDREMVDRTMGMLIQVRLCAEPGAAEWHRGDTTVFTKLSKKAEGVIFYVRTAVDFVAAGGHIAEMERRLQLLITSGQTRGLSKLDLLYLTVLENEFPPPYFNPVTREQFRTILAWTAFCEDYGYIGTYDIEEISGISRLDSRVILAKLHSVLRLVSGMDAELDPIRGMHITLRDFLVDLERCGDDFHMDPANMHSRLAEHCLGFLHKHHCEIDRPNYHACERWYTHAVQSASPSEELVGLLKEIFASVSTAHPSLFFSHPSPLPSDCSSGMSLLCWVDKHIVSIRAHRSWP